MDDINENLESIRPSNTAQIRNFLFSMHLNMCSVYQLNLLKQNVPEKLNMRDKIAYVIV